MRGPVITGTHSGVGKTAVAPGLAASILFFVVTNFGVWALDSLYPRTLEGLVICYVAAIPFFANTLAGTLFYTAVLFGGVPWSKFAHMFYKPAAAFQKKVEEANGSSNLPRPANVNHIVR